MAVADLSYAMGAFTAGVMLADSSCRHEVVDVLRRAFRDARLVGRAYDRLHAVRLGGRDGVDAIVRETMEGGLEAGEAALGLLGHPAEDGRAIVGRVRAADRARLVRETEAASGALDRDAVLEAIVPRPVGRPPAGTGPSEDPPAPDDVGARTAYPTTG